MKARRDELFAAHKDEWFPTTLEFRTRGGFVSAVAGTFTALAKSPLFANQPIVEATISKIDIAKLVKALVAAAHPSSELLRGSIDGAKGFAQIVASPNVQQLTALNVTTTNLGADAMKSLKSYLPALRSLVLTGNELGAGGIAALVAWPHLATLETLYLSKCDLSTAERREAALEANAEPRQANARREPDRPTRSARCRGRAANVPRKLEQLELACNSASSTAPR